MKATSFLILLLFLICNKSPGIIHKIVGADTGKYIIMGIISDSGSKQKSGSSTIFFNRKFSTVSDAEGNFKLTLPIKYTEKNFSILVTYAMYEPLKIKIKNKNSPLTNRLTIYLKKRNFDLNEVMIICSLFS